ncbi:MAG TPA: hypothetical protein VHZ73_06175 [Vicinamibacterales bacterium]|nr:hypothetical protein [Vicinamibacterales bacterium]
MQHVLRRATVAVAALAASVLVTAQAARPQADAGFGAEIARLSEPGGSFDTDNLISNESSYLDVIPALIARGTTGGAYIGVGPDQNFSYIARVRPSVAYIIDVRRDNLLLHLLFRALFSEARNRAEFLSLLTGRAPPGGPTWNTASLKSIVAYVDGRPASSQVPAIERRLEMVIAAFGVSLSRADFDTIARFHRSFVNDGLSLQFHTLNRGPQPYYPTLRDLLLATDASGHPWNYLDLEDDYQFLRSLEGQGRVIPVVGDVAGPRAMRAIAADIGARGERVSAFYISNVENYLFRDGTFSRYADNISRLPRTNRSMVIRSVFSGGGQSIQRVQPLELMPNDIARGAYRSYYDLTRASDR